MGSFCSLTICASNSGLGIVINNKNLLGFGVKNADFEFGL